MARLLAGLSPIETPAMSRSRPIAPVVVQLSKSPVASLEPAPVFLHQAGLQEHLDSSLQVQNGVLQVPWGWPPEAQIVGNIVEVVDAVPNRGKIDFIPGRCLGLRLTTGTGPGYAVFVFFHEYKAKRLSDAQVTGKTVQV
ncbi:hypothetical protein [Streptomyces sp. 35G-GA-8]|uniref:hypothetical protein n=1 Tax=Streptomyces sp. 35G-GA-8 TaxID=2939434 RepID=UPI00201F761D|nr:hypothetical protein [Streptomyces sp. 35G-GA-8]MCL7382538.1 hypothetical protein [Streptomyces sp. 35G-GA-8]